MTTTLDRVHGQLKRSAVILALFLLLANAGAWSQNGLPSPDLPQNLRSTEFRPAQEQRQELRSAQSLLPDAPSAVLTTQRTRFRVFVEARSPLIFDGAAINASMARESPEHVVPGVTPSSSALYRAPVVQKESTVFLDRYFHPSPLGQGLRYYPSTSDSFLDRVNYAASGLFFTRDDFGKRKVNTPYLLGVLTSAACAANLYRPRGTLTASATFDKFGSTIGRDAGRNVFHAFWPGIHQILRRHSLKVLERVEERIGGDPTPAAPGSARAR